MAQLRNFHLYPYSGAEETPWHWGRDIAMPYDDATLDQDSAARTSRRVFEDVSAGLTSLGIASRRSSYRLFAVESQSNEVEVRANRRLYANGAIGHIGIPAGFHLLEPDGRAEVLLQSLSAAFKVLASFESRDAHQIDSLIEKSRERGYRCTWASPWRLSRSRKRKIQMLMRLADDGYGRWHLVIADVESGAVLMETEEVLGWTWVENYVRAFKAMKFVSANVVEVGIGSTMFTRTVEVDIETGEIRRAQPDPVPIVYPGVSSRVSRLPAVVVSETE
jgi:hypothetical protein